MTEDPIITIQGLTKTFTKDGVRVEVLRGIDLVVPRGESLAIVGASGAGKSTLLNILGTLDRPTSGMIHINGLDIFAGDDRTQAQFRNRTIGFVFQLHNLMPEFTALENVMLPALIGGLGRAEAKRRATTILTELGLAQRFHHRSGELSGGEQQRVAVGRAIVMHPQIILADEPTGNLDRETGNKIEDVLIELNRKQQITLILVTHNPRLAERMSRTIGLEDGKIA